MKGIVSSKKAPLYKCGYTGKVKYISKEKIEEGEFNLSEDCQHIVFLHEGELLSQKLTNQGQDFLLSFMEKGIEENHLPIIFHYYGELLPVDLVIPDSLTLKYGFQLKRVAGDDLNDAIINETKKFNKSSFVKMEEKYGENWRKEFEQKTGKELKYYLDN